MPKKKEKKQNRAKKAEESIPNLLSIGELDLIFKIEFKKEDLEKSESKSSSEGKTEYYELEEINELKDLSFLQENEDLWDKFQLKGGNETINSLLIGNKNNKKKCQIEYICFGLPQFEGEEEFFEEIFEHVTTKNGLNINKTPLKEGARYSLKIEMKSEKEVKIIEIGKTEEEEKNEKNENDKEEKDEEAEKKKKEGDQNGNEIGQGGEEEEEEDEDYEENDAMLDKRIPKFKRSKSVLCNLDPSSTKYEMVYLNYEDFSKIPGDFQMEDMIEFLTFLKKKNSTIFINFYKKEISSQPQQEEKVKQDNKNEKNKKEEQNDKKGEENKEEKAGDNKDEKDKKEEKNEENKKEEEKKEEKKEEDKKDEGKKEEEKKEEGKKEEQEKKEEEKNVDGKKEEDIKEEEKKEEDNKDDKKDGKKTQSKKDDKQQDTKYRTKNAKIKNKSQTQELQLLNKIYYLTDVYFFDTEQAVKIFDTHYKTFTLEEPKKI